MPKGSTDDPDDIDLGDEDRDDEPIPARRDTKIFQHKKEEKKDSDDDFEEDVFV